MIDYEASLDNYLISGIDMLFNQQLGKVVKDTLVELRHDDNYSDLEEKLNALINNDAYDASGISDNMVSLITNFSTEYLKTLGINLTENELNHTLALLITVNELTHLSRETAIELSTIIGDDELGDEYNFAGLVEYFTKYKQLEIYEIIDYVKPSVMSDIIMLIDNTIENVYNDTDTINELYNSSYLYTTFINDPLAKLSYDDLMDKLLSYCNTTTNVQYIAREVSIVIMFSKDVENEIYFAQTVVTEDLMDSFMGTELESSIQNIIENAIRLIKE